MKNYSDKGYSSEYENHADPIRDYFMSHPPLKLRIEKYEEKAKAWWKLHSKKKRYIGKKNFINRIVLKKRDCGESEWVTYNQIITK